jgi:hypothetical protein
VADSGCEPGNHEKMVRGAGYEVAREGGTMRERLAKRVHAAEPAPGSFRAMTGDGDDADLFNLNHYPVHAVCRVCNEPIYAEAFLRAFRHEELLLSSGGTTPRTPRCPYGPA